MKKIIVLAMVLTTLATAAFANINDAVNQKVRNAFSKSYKSAEEVRWEIKDNLYKATFKTGGQEMYAYYNKSGEQVALGRNLHVNQLPLTLAVHLKGMYNEQWLTDLFEVSQNGETAYYATLQSATHVTIVKAEGTSGWYTFKRDKIK
jgi:hypothetical protein